MTDGVGGLNISAVLFFAGFVAITLVITAWASRRSGSADAFLAAGHRISWPQNGMALAGDFIAAAGFLGISGLISLSGFDGIIYYLGGLVGWPIMLFLFCGPLRNLGRFTVGDVVAFRMDSASVRMVTSITTLAIVIFYLVGQLVGAGVLVGLLFDLPYEAAVISVGLLMLVYVLFGGMIATTWVQIIKTVLMMIGAVAAVLLALSQFNFSFGSMFSAATDAYGQEVLRPGRMTSNFVETLSLSMALVFGVASLPHVLIRFFTVPDAETANRSLTVATGIIATFVCITFVLGIAAMAIVGTDAIVAADRGGNMAVPLLAEKIGGAPFFGFISAVSFATILAVVSGLMITGAAAIAHDLWYCLIRRENAAPGEQVFAARCSSVTLAAIAIVLALAAKGQNVAVLVGLTTAVASSANFPVLFLAIYWRRLSAAGAVSGMLAGLLVSIGMIVVSPVVQIDMLHKESALIPLNNPAILSMPIAFAAAVVVSVFTQPVSDDYYFMTLSRVLFGEAASKE